MEKDLNDQEIIIDPVLIWKTACYRKQQILACFLIIISAVFLIINFMPKSYNSQAKILINKGNATNLADINPFILSDMTAAKDAGLTLLSANNLNNEIEILKSPILIDRVIRDNNLRCNKGAQKGSYLSTDDFLRKKFSVKNPKGSNIINIIYESNNPKLSYSIVKSVIKNYREIYKDINSNKAFSDTNFLKKSYQEAQKSVDKKIQEIKLLKSESKISYADAKNLGISGMGLYDKQINTNVSEINNAELKNRKLEIELNQEVDKLKMLKTKYEWSALIQGMSKNATNMIILREPAIMRESLASKPAIVVVLSILVFLILSFMAVSFTEIIDSRLTYMDDDNFILRKNANAFSILQTKLIANNIKETGVISLLNEEISKELINSLSQSLSAKNIKISLTSENDSMDRHIDNISSTDYVIILAQIGYTQREIYKEINFICNEFKKNTDKFFLSA